MCSLPLPDWADIDPKKRLWPKRRHSFHSFDEIPSNTAEIVREIEPKLDSEHYDLISSPEMTGTCSMKDLEVDEWSK